MAQRRTARLLAALVVGVLVAASPGLWRWYSAPPAGHCPICLRHEHKESMVKFQAAGGPLTEACCLSCALTYARQTHKAVEIVAVTDHESGRQIAPETASFVVGSDVSPCTHATARLAEEKEELAVQWDRCLPGILAFASAESAEAFRAQHGGRRRSLAQLIDAGGAGK